MRVYMYPHLYGLLFFSHKMSGMCVCERVDTGTDNAIIQKLSLRSDLRHTLSDGRTSAIIHLLCLISPSVQLHWLTTSHPRPQSTRKSRRFRSQERQCIRWPETRCRAWHLM